MLTRTALALCLLTSLACGGNSPTAPTTPAPTPIAAAALTLNPNASWTSCLPAIGGFIGSCVFQGSIQNTGAGCAGGVTAVVQLKDGTGQQLGSDRTALFIMASGHIIRAAETIQFQTLSVDLPTVNATKTFGLKPAWTNVACP